jgi:hypothetical protein
VSAIQIYEQKDFTGGLNLRSDQFQLKDNESPEMLNVEIDPRGGVFSRGAMQRLNPADVTGTTWNPHRLFSFYGSSSNLMLANNNRVYYMSTSNNFALLNTDTGPVNIESPDGACFAAWGETLYIGAGDVGTTGFYKWTGSHTTNAVALPRVSTSPDKWATRENKTSGGHVPRAEHLAVHANKMFAAHTHEDGSEFPNRLRWSDESLPENWVAEDYIDIQGGGDGIRGIVVVNGALVIFKPYAIYVLYGYTYTDFRVIQISGSLGCSAHAQMAATDTGVYFYSHDDGLFFFDGSNIIDVFNNMKPAFDLNYINPAQDDSVSLTWLGRRLWLSLPYSIVGDAAGPTLNLLFDPSIDAYMMFSTADSKGVVGGCDYRNSTGTDLKLMLHPTVPAVLQVDMYDESVDKIAVSGAQVGYPTVYRTKWFDAGSYMQRKMFRRPDLVMKESETQLNVNVNVYHDFQESNGSEARTFDVVLPTAALGMFWDDDSWANESVDGSVSGSLWSGGVISSTIKTAKNLGLAKTVQLRFSGELGKPWGINSIGYKWTPRRVKG